jgi:hypothetical protein
VWLAHYGKASRNSVKEPNKDKMKKTIHMMLVSARKTDYRLERYAEKHPRRPSMEERCAAAVDLIGGQDYRAAQRPHMFTPFADLLPSVAKLG